MSASFSNQSVVIPGLAPGTHDLPAKWRSWVAGTSPAMTKLLKQQENSGHKESSLFVLILGLYSQNDHKLRHPRPPARRASRGGSARAAQTARPQGEGGGGQSQSRNYLAEEAGRGAPRQSQRAETWCPVRGVPRALQSHPHDCPQAERSLRAHRHPDERWAEPKRPHRGDPRWPAHACRLAGRRSGAAR